MKKTVFTVLHAAALFFVLPSNCYTSNLLLAATQEFETNFEEEFGRCTIVAQKLNPTPALSGHAAKKQRLCMLGRIEISWVVRPGSQPLASITDLRVDKEFRGQGLGTSLFQAAITFLTTYLESPQITWKAQPLDNTTSLDDLILFYKKQGGVVTRLLTKLDIACMQLPLDRCCSLFRGLENRPSPQDLCAFVFEQESAGHQLQISTFNVVIKSITPLKQTTSVFTDKTNINFSPQPVQKLAPSPRSIRDLSPVSTKEALDDL